MDEIRTDAKGVRTTPDLSGNGNDMTLGADVTDGETGVEGGALKFVDSATSLGTAVMKGTVFEATYACWIRPKKGSSASSPKAVRYAPARSAIEYAVRSGQGFAIEGKDFNKRFPNEIRMFKIDKPIEDQSVILAWHVNHCPEAALNFINEVTRTARQIEKEKR